MLRPDTLPFFKPVPRRLGLYYHGAVQGGALTVGAITKTHAQPSSGDAYMVQHPKFAEPVYGDGEEARLTAAGKELLPYAYLSGGTRMIGGVELGTNRWLYCDQDNTWVMRWEVEDDALCIYVDSLFGRFGRAVDAGDYDMTPRKILTYEFTEDNQAVFSYLWSIHHSMSKTGAKSCFNLLVLYESPFQYYDAVHTGTQRFGYYSICADVLQVCTVQISGNGSLVKGSVGTGISAAATTVISDFSETYWSDGETVENDILSGCACPRIPSSPCSTGSTTEEQCTDPTSPDPNVRNLWFSDNGHLLWFVNSAGVLKTIDFTLRTDRAGLQSYDGVCTWREDPACAPGGACEGWSSCSQASSDTVTYTLTVAGKAVSFGPAVHSESQSRTITSSGCTDTGMDVDCDSDTAQSDSGWYYTMEVGDYVPSPILHGTQNIVVALQVDGSAKAISMENGSDTDAGLVASQKFSYDIGKSTWHTSTSVIGVV